MVHLCLKHDINSAIWLIWLLITTTAIPVALSHGVLNLTSYTDANFTVCVFLSNEGYSHVAFQVIAFKHGFYI